MLIRLFGVLFLLSSSFTLFVKTGELPQASPESVGMSSERLARIDGVMQRYIDNGDIAGGVTLVARHGKVVQYEAYGLASSENNTPMEKDTLFRFFSMTKQVTAVAMLMLLEDGEFNLSDPVSRYIPEFANPEVLVPCGEGVTDCEGDYKLEPAHREITIQHLMSHTSGITYVFNSRPFITDLYKQGGVHDALKQSEGTVGDMVKKLAALPLYGHPGELHEYGLSYDVLGYLVEVISGKNLGDFCQERIFDPLGMVDTHFWVPEDKLDRLAAAYSLDDEGNRFLMPDGENNWLDFSYSPDFQYNGPQTFYSGGAGMVSTATDYATFLIMQANNGQYKGKQYLGRKTIDLMRHDHVGDLPGDIFLPGYGFGLGPAIHRDRVASNRLASLSEWRWAGLFHTWYQVDHDEGLVSIVLTQLWPDYASDMEARFNTAVSASVVSSPGRAIKFKQ